MTEKVKHQVSCENISITVGKVKVCFSRYVTSSCSLVIIQNISVYPTIYTAVTSGLSSQERLDTLTKEQKKYLFNEFKKVIGPNKIVITQQNGNSVKPILPLLKLLKFRKSAKFNKYDKPFSDSAYGMGYFYKWQSKDHV